MSKQTKMIIGIAIPLMLFVSMLFVSGCGKNNPTEAEEVTSPKEVYEKYVETMKTGDLDQIMEFLSDKHAGDLKGINDKQRESVLQMTKKLSSGEYKIAQEKINGTVAVLKIEKEFDGLPFFGRINFIKQSGEWKIDEENWSNSKELHDDYVPFGKENQLYEFKLGLSEFGKNKAEFSFPMENGGLYLFAIYGWGDPLPDSKKIKLSIKLYDKDKKLISSNESIRIARSKHINFGSLSFSDVKKSDVKKVAYFSTTIIYVPKQ